MKSSVIKDLGILIFRVGVAYLMLAFHGLQKVQYLFSGDEIQFADPIGIGVELSFIFAAFAEFVCAILIGLGLFTRWAAIPLAFTMIVAVFGFHGADPFIDKQLPTLFMLSFILLALVGGGKFSLGQLFGRKFA